jgi:hypothetical protein
MYLAKRALASVSWSTPSVYPEENTFKQTQIHLPFADHKVHAFGANYISVNKVSKLQDAGFEWTTTFCVDKDVRALFLQVSSVPAYDPLPIVQASPEGRPKTIGLMNLSRIKGMSSVTTDTDNVVVYPRWYGLKAPQFTRDTLAATFDSVLAGKSVKDAYTDAANKISAELAKKK